LRQDVGVGMPAHDAVREFICGTSGRHRRESGKGQTQDHFLLDEIMNANGSVGSFIPWNAVSAPFREHPCCRPRQTAVKPPGSRRQMATTILRPKVLTRKNGTD